jgi:hypothetical protein
VLARIVSVRFPQDKTMQKIAVATLKTIQGKF